VGRRHHLGLAGYYEPDAHGRRKLESLYGVGEDVGASIPQGNKGNEGNNDNEDPCFAGL
jgi:hypothetical protein